MNSLIASLDLGGTKVSANLVSSGGNLLVDTVSRPVDAQRSRNEVLATIVETITRSWSAAGVSASDLIGLGVGVPGPLDAEKGTLLTPPNLPTLHHFNFSGFLQEKLGLPVRIESDGNVFALGEAVFGGGQGFPIVLGITLGTGFGNGVVIKEKIFRGATGTAAEAFFSPYRDGIFDDYVSGRALVGFHKCRTEDQLEPSAIAQLARRGDREAVGAWEELGFHTGIAISHLVNVLDPHVVVCGGSLSRQWDLFRDKLEETLREHINPRPRQYLRLVQSQLYDQANLLGSACLFAKED